MRYTYPRVLSIAGSDSGGGAGIQADLKTFSAIGTFGMTAITAITAQNTCGVTAIQGLPPALIGAQIDAVFEDIGVDAVKIGMLHAPDIVAIVADRLRAHRPRIVILDPVMVATSGAKLIENETIAVLMRELFPLADLVTPNLDELAILSGGNALGTVEQMEQAARGLLATGCKAVLAKGGHLTGDQLTDLHVEPDQTRIMTAPRIPSSNLHGTGCTLSSAIAAYCSLGAALPQAIDQGRAFIRAAIAAGADVSTGRGHGPLNHGWGPQIMHKRPI